MRSRISFCNFTVLKKNLTRFFPAWTLYGLFLMMVYLPLGDIFDSAYYASVLAQAIPIMVILRFLYSLLCSLLIFGDLFKSRMCNAIHAMPLRRDTLFITNILSCLLFALVPDTLFALLSMLLIGEIWPVALLWLGAGVLQYLFFFGTAVLSVFCTGKRFATVLVYLILNFLSMIFLWLITGLYEPSLYGVILNQEIFTFLCPFAQMLSFGSCVVVNYIPRNGTAAFASWSIGEGWGYMAVCAGIGIGLMALAWLAYRRRNLECAGDFLAFSWLKPVFLVLYTLCFCALFQFLFFDSFLSISIFIGFFTGLMLLERKVNVFRKKTFLGFGVFLLAIALSFGAVYLDVFGIVRWVPKANQVQGVSLTAGPIAYYIDDASVTTDPEQIEQLLAVHRHGIQNRNAAYDDKQDMEIALTYYMKDGSTHQRTYAINHDTEAGATVKAYISSPRYVLGEIYTENCPVLGITVQNDTVRNVSGLRIQPLMDAIIKDAEEGNMPQDWSFTEDADFIFWIEIEYRTPEGKIGVREIRASSECVHTVAWLRQLNWLEYN